MAAKPNSQLSAVRCDTLVVARCCNTLQSAWRLRSYTHAWHAAVMPLVTLCRCVRISKRDFTTLNVLHARCNSVEGQLERDVGSVELVEGDGAVSIRLGNGALGGRGQHERDVRGACGASIWAVLLTAMSSKRQTRGVAHMTHVRVEQGSWCCRVRCIAATLPQANRLPQVSRLAGCCLAPLALDGIGVGVGIWCNASGALGLLVTVAVSVWILHFIGGQRG